MMLDIDKLEQAALASTNGCDGIERIGNHVEMLKLLSPSAVLELINRLRAAEKDAARLNFLDENINKNIGWSCGIAPFGNVSMQSVLCSKKTVREAIDAAMKEKS